MSQRVKTSARELVLPRSSQPENGHLRKNNSSRMSRVCSFQLQFVFLFKYGSIPVSIDFWKIVVRPGVIAHSVSILLGSPSGQDIFLWINSFH